MYVFRHLKQFFWQDKRFLFGSLIGITLATALGLVYPVLLGILIDDMILQGKYEGVTGLALTAFGVVVLKASFQYLHGFCGGRLGNRLAYRLRNACYEKLQALSFSFYDKARTGDLMSRLTADIEGIRNFIGFGLAQLLNSFLLIVFSFAAMCWIEWRVALPTFLFVPALAFVAIRFEQYIHPIFRSIRVTVGRLTTVVQENIMGVRTVKSFSREPFEIEKFSVRNKEYRERHLDMAKAWGTYFPMIEFIANFSVVFLLGLGGYMVIRQWMSLGDLASLTTLVGMMVAPLWGLGFQINNYTQSKAAGERMLELLHHPVTVQSKADCFVLRDEDVRGHVRFEGVTFWYPTRSEQETALADFNLDAPPGSVIGLLGGTGAGKTTVIQLLMRAYDVTRGAVLLDGVDVRQIELASLRRQIGIVFQETFLFSTTIRENIAYGKPEATMEEIERAARLAQAHDFILELPQGYDTVVGERGLGLSGGQKQRIAIARALLQQPKILVLDDATSALDMETEQAIQQALREVMKDRTTFIIAHRISSLRHADEIIVLDRGRVADRGTHDELVRRPGLYRDTYLIQYADRPEALDEAVIGRRARG